MSFTTEQNKQIVKRFNKECIELGLTESFEELLHDKVINHASAPGAPNGKDSFYLFLNGILRKGFSGLKVEIKDQVAEKDMVCTRKEITGTHTGEIFGIAPSHKTVVIHVIDIIRLENGKYMEHWGRSNFDDVLKQIAS